LSLIRGRKNNEHHHQAKLHQVRPQLFQRKDYTRSEKTDKILSHFNYRST
jgi:hypothetical protein